MTETPILVHKYVFSGDGESATQGSRVAILQEGRHVVEQTFGSLWNDTKQIQVPFGKKTVTVNAYAFGRAAPQIPRDPDVAQAGPLKEWGESAEDDEVFYMENLSEFESTSLDDLEHIMNASSLDKRSRSPVTEEPSKRQKLDVMPLDEVIPEPHILPSGDAKAPDLTKLAAYTKNVPLSIPPYTLPVSTPSSYSRRAWLIPVRGVLPWDAATSAVVLDPDISPQTPLPRGSLPSEPIVWTHTALLSFWNYLVSFRQKARFGALGLSFMTPESRRLPSLNANLHLDLSDDDSEEVARLLERNREVQNRDQHPLTSLDYIKVYHNAEVSMHVRNGIDVFRFKPSSSNQKIKLMEGARLVLVDELSNGVLIS
ncbi:hypothetical protein VNI00_014967 [Paramarasmius palmivorus]|uniref:Uncharacterized protein n=1 Tax=Paramarasmius palmivorus TaxID=297713 RepID=A0AAW0BNC0_9AGAR